MALVARHGFFRQPQKKSKDDRKPRGPTPAKIVRAAERDGVPLQLHHGGRRRQTYLLDGKVVDPKHAAAAIGGGRLEPAGDGLFGTSQTWIARGPDPTTSSPKERAVAKYFRRVDADLARRSEATRLRLLPLWDDETRNIANNLIMQAMCGIGTLHDDETPGEGIVRLYFVAKNETDKKILTQIARWIERREKTDRCTSRPCTNQT